MPRVKPANQALVDHRPSGRIHYWRFLPECGTSLPDRRRVWGPPATWITWPISIRGHSLPKCPGCPHLQHSSPGVWGTPCRLGRVLAFARVVGSGIWGGGANCGEGTGRARSCSLCPHVQGGRQPGRCRCATAVPLTAGMHHQVVFCQGDGGLHRRRAVAANRCQSSGRQPHQDLLQDDVCHHTLRP